MATGAVALALHAHNDASNNASAFMDTTSPEQDAAARNSNGGTSIKEQPSEQLTPPAQEKKSKRVRTGCLTCRDRHLKCDEGVPTCQNCTKSNRECKRGLRISFMDTNMHAPPVLLAPSADWAVSFQDESREIASEYKGGIEKYAVRTKSRSAEPQAYHNTSLAFHHNHHDHDPNHHHDLRHLDHLDHHGHDLHHRPSFSDLGSDHASTTSAYAVKGFHQVDHQQQQQQLPLHDPALSLSMASQTAADAFMTNPQDHVYPMPEMAEEPPVHPQQESQRPDYLVDQEEVLFMQVFVEEVGIWMDSMDSKKHFSRQLPFHALKEPMLLNAFLACGARHLALVNPRYSDDKALRYYDLATKHLLDALQDPSRDTILCATTAVILNVYEIMCEKALQRMNHIAGARALIKECNWSARSQGIGAACFWLNVGMELLSCLHFNWQVAWDPEEWGVDMDMQPELESGCEERWTHRIVYITAKVCNFRAAMSHGNATRFRNQQQQYAEWRRLRDLAERWDKCIPRTMQPVAYLFPGQTLSGSAFPEVWLIKRASIVARLFYHTCMCLLAQINPLLGADNLDMRQMLETHSQLICGISAHVKDRGVASVALRSLAIAAECLTERRSREEVLQIIDKIQQETGWRVGFIKTELQEKWGWNNGSSEQQQQQAQQQQAQQQQAQQQQQALPPPQQAPRPAMRPMFNNPLANISFNNPQHPYQEVYVAPNGNHVLQAGSLPPPTQPQQPQQDPNGFTFY